jgi:hypothetical protein
MGRRCGGYHPRLDRLAHSPDVDVFDTLTDTESRRGATLGDRGPKSGIGRARRG